MNVLVIGSGGREHALVWKLSQSDTVTKIYAAPGNIGMRHLAECVPLAVDDIDGLVDFALEQDIHLTVVGPELPLTLGVVDRFREQGLRCFGPSKVAAELEGSKAFSKDLMRRYNIPTAAYESFTDYDQACAYIEEIGVPCVVKADGLAAGKGVIICETKNQAIDALGQMLNQSSFGEAGARVVVEEFLQGQEVSVLAFADGTHVVPMVSAQDHKRIFDGDQGPNTGGMGAYTPAPIYTEELAAEVEETIIKPTIRAMAEEGRPFSGILYTGLMLTNEGPKVLEYNARFGDPETQPVLMRMKSDLYEVFEAAIDQKLNEVALEWDDDAAVCVVLASGGYPGTPEKGKVISGLESDFSDQVMVFHAGTAAQDDAIITNGGRVLNVTALGKDIPTAIAACYDAVSHISFENMQYRKDIGAKAVKAGE